MLKIDSSVSLLQIMHSTFLAEMNLRARCVNRALGQVMVICIGCYCFVVNDSLIICSKREKSSMKKGPLTLF